MSNKEPIWTKPFISLFATNLSIFIVFYGLVTVLPLYAKEQLSRTDEEAGLLMTIFMISAILVRPFTGKILDIVGKRKMLGIGLIFYVVCTFLYYFISPFEGLLVIRFVQGVWFSIVSTATISLAADYVPESRRGAGLGYFSMSLNLAVVIGPFIALTIIQSFSFDIFFILLSVLMAIGALASLTLPPEPVQHRPSGKFTITFNDLFEKKALPVAIFGCVIAFSYASVLSYLSIFAQQQGLLDYASIFFVVYAAVMLISRPYTGRLFDEKGPAYVIIPGLIFFIIGFFLLADVHSVFVFLLAGAFIGFGYGSILPSMQTLAVQSTDASRSGYATATFYTLFDSGIAVGSYVLGLIAVYTGYQTVYVLSAGIVIMALLGYLALGKKKKAVR
ncbi:antibiotic resistance protein [Bacillus sp. OxB-1]|uniref:MFS transporter n=1 Tax=Bacillus sp. (strain OxB-1) TaxID=98228 RepID=UPI0005822956|nr:MFS transporter [Bacillus sp. OxB-1]BAQ11847.1 antibiotic resistance protein [Bacillus sp. OxB-1]